MIGRRSGGTNPRTKRARTLQQVAAVTAALALLAAPVVPARADPDPRAEARVAFTRGYALAEAGRYAEAIAHFTRAYELSPHFAVLYNLGQAYAAAGQPGPAVDALKRYLAEGGPQIPPARRTQVETEILEQERVWRTAGAGAQPAARSAAAPTPAPPLREPQTSQRSQTSGASPPAPPATGGTKLEIQATASGAGRPTAATDGSRSRLRAAVVVGGLGLALESVAAILYFWNSDRYETWSDRHDSLSREPPSPDRDVLQQANDDLARSIRSVSVVDVSLALVGVGLLATGAVLALTARKRDEAPAPPSQAFGVGRGLLQWRVTF